MTNREYLFHLERHGIKLGLDNIRHLLEKAGNPHAALPSVHVAGTNGKGSAVAMTAAVLRAAGYKTGCFTSPHLIDVTERFLINGQPMTDADFDEEAGLFRGIAEAMDSPPTFFELNTAIAFHWFARQCVDVAVVEVGMGGRLDSTNVLRPLCAAITNIDLEHTQYLGDTIETIASEKAGILKRGVPAVIGETKPGPLRVILDRAQEIGAPATVLGRDFHVENVDGLFLYQSAGLVAGPLRLGLRGQHQAQNAGVAVAVLQQVRGRFQKITEETICAGLAGVRWPCRLEQVLDHPPVIVDVAHNPAGAMSLRDEITPGITILAVSSDKDARRIVEALAPVTRLFILTRYASARSLSVEALEAAAADLPHQCAANLDEAIHIGLSLASDDQPLLITGSIFTAGEARQILIKKYAAPPLQF